QQPYPWADAYRPVRAAAECAFGADDQDCDDRGYGDHRKGDLQQPGKQAHGGHLLCTERSLRAVRARVERDPGSAGWLVGEVARPGCWKGVQPVEAVRWIPARMPFREPGFWMDLTSYL